jgi:endonuclease/exonuclease/phosphatase family metal-dependent hydrolase
MNVTMTHDLSLMSWNILAPCWVKNDWYPTLFTVASDYHTRLSTIVSYISSCQHDVITLQEVQEETMSILEEMLSNNYTLQFAWNNPTDSSNANGLATLIRKKWRYASEVQITNEILDQIEGEAIQIITIPSKGIHLVNLHLNWIHRLAQAKVVLRRCRYLLGDSYNIAIIAGDLNAEIQETTEFQWNHMQAVFQELTDETKIPTYYSDGLCTVKGQAIDHIFYDSTQVQLIKSGKAWDVQHGSLADILKLFGSDHVFVWAVFDFSQKSSFS